MHVPFGGQVVREDTETILFACKEELSALAGSTVLLTGGSGFVGSSLVESVMEYNRVHAAKPIFLLLPTRSLEKTRLRWPQFFTANEVRWFEWDGITLDASPAPCEYVVHGAASADAAAYMQDPAGAMQAMIRSTKAVLNFVKQSGTRRFLYLSSGAVYGEQPSELSAIPEEYMGAPALDDPRSCYGEAKRYCELMCQVAGVPMVVARLFSFLGPYLDMRASFAVADFIRQADKDGAVVIHGDGGASRTYCYSTDLCIALWKLLIKGSAGVAYNVGARDPVVTIREVAETIAQIMNVSTIQTEGCSHSGRRRYVPEITRLEEIYIPRVAFRDALARTICSLQERALIGRRNGSKTDVSAPSEAS